MIRKKNSFFTFCFSFIPGAGQMYMGFMKRGITLMSVFIFTIIISAWLRMDVLLLALPIIWFYAFFDTFNLRSTPDDEFYSLEDNFLFPSFSAEMPQFLQGKLQTILAFVLIVIGFSILWNNIYYLFRSILPLWMRDLMSNFGHYFPQLVMGYVIISLGIYLIIGKKKDLNSTDKIKELEDKGGLN